MHTRMSGCELIQSLGDRTKLQLLLNGRRCRGIYDFHSYAVCESRLETVVTIKNALLAPAKPSRGLITRAGRMTIT